MGNQHPLNSKKGGLRSPTIRKLAKDGTTWTPTEQIQRDKCLKQFCKSGRKGVEVSSGNSDAYKRGWIRMFGTDAEKAELEALELRKFAGQLTDVPLFSLIPAGPDSREPPAWSATITGIDP